ncbi:MAG: membrane protein insertase YidC [Methylococcales symbiont of Hymedesmia sp. n. MRB-2018]|nr:MAG: membrane protein insertase YidC [Methylococcales symbiont of Hymedesmia sp. n. MRB-2018]KAF3983312.1 MAG: membrane protein insertase YidC [Methylococcales symbiont of Hymedesmia sp. n. MRB-2018]
MENMRVLLVLAFMMTSYLIWEAWQLDYAPKPVTNVSELPVINDSDGDLPVAGNVQNITTNKNAEVVPMLEAPTDKIITVVTDVFSLEIDTKGGTIRNLDLLQHPREKVNTVVNDLRAMIGLDAEEKDERPVRLFNGNTEKLFLAQSGLIANNGSSSAPNHNALFSSDKDQYALAIGEDSLSVPLYWQNKEGLVVTKTYVFTRGSYDIGVNQTVNNNSTKAWSGRQYAQLMRVPFVDDKGNTFIRTYAGGVVYTAEDLYQKIDYEEMEDEDLSVSTLGGWSAMIQHYFASAWIPPVDQKNHFYTKKSKGFRYVIGSYSPAFEVTPQTESVFTSHLFAGPKIQPMMEAIAPGLELTVDYGWLTIIGKPIYWLLNQIHGYIGNWGLSILGVTLCIKLLFFKLSQASFRSMAKMRKIQPRLKELKDKFEDDRQRFNTEMMAMYKREKVNPMGGCLPILVQIPVFISLYWVLIETVELRQAGLTLWIQDLSAQDPFFVLPVIMGITMKLQQSLNPAPIDPLQAKVMRMFPIIFTVFFLFFPAGLVFYWVCNNTLSFLQQWYITRQIEAEEN